MDRPGWRAIFVGVTAERNALGQRFHIGHAGDRNRSGFCSTSGSGKHHANPTPGNCVDVVACAHADQATNRVVDRDHGTLAELALEPLGFDLLPRQRAVFVLDLFDGQGNSMHARGGWDFASEANGRR